MHVSTISVPSARTLVAMKLHTNRKLCVAVCLQSPACVLASSDSGSEEDEDESPKKQESGGIFSSLSHGYRKVKQKMRDAIGYDPDADDDDDDDDEDDDGEGNRVMVCISSTLPCSEFPLCLQYQRYLWCCLPDMPLLFVHGPAWCRFGHPSCGATAIHVPVAVAVSTPLWLQIAFALLLCVHAMFFGVHT